MNKLIKSLICDGQISLSVLDTKNLVQTARDIHNLDDASAQILGGFLTAAAYMAGCLKNEKGAVSLTVKSGDGSCTVSVSGDYLGHIRGYIDGGSKLSGGTLTVIRDDGFFRPFVGCCPLSGGDVSKELEKYFETSEQIATRVNFGVKVSKGKCLAAGGVVAQYLPGTSEENARLADECVNAIISPADEIEKLGAEGVADKFPKGGKRYIYAPEYRCNCSRKKIEGVIISLGKPELLKIIEEEGQVKVHCHYCNTDYKFSLEDVNGLFGEV